jgi:gliding motility-associated-like protein
MPLNVQFSNTTKPEAVETLWDFGDGQTSDESNPVHTYFQPGAYSVSLTVTTENGCTYDTTYASYIEVVDDPHATIVATPQPALVTDPTISFTAQGDENITSWQWNFGDNVPSVESESPLFTFPSIAGTYPVQLIIINDSGCSDTISTFITVTNDVNPTFPNVFTPNGDGSNDRFLPFEEYPGNYRLTIRNRWGAVVFMTESIERGWTGDNAPEGTYYWILEPLEGRPEQSSSGYLTLLRGE